MPDRERKGVIDYRFNVLKGSLPLGPSAHPGNTRSGMGIVHENENFHGSETDCREKNCPQGKETGGTRKIGRTGFSSAPNTHETYEANSHVDIAHRGCVIVNTITCCCCRGLATGLTQSFLHASALCFSFLKKQMLQKFFRVFLLNQFPSMPARSNNLSRGPSVWVDSPSYGVSVLESLV